MHPFCLQDEPAPLRLTSKRLRASLTPLRCRSQSAPTPLLLHSHAAIKLQLCHLSRCTVTDANQRVYSLQHSGARVTRLAQLRACGRRALGHLLAPHAQLLLPRRERLRAPTSRTWPTRRRASRVSAAVRACAQAASCPTTARLVL